MQRKRSENHKQLSSAAGDDQVVNSKYFGERWELEDRNARRFLRIIFPAHPFGKPWRFTKREADRLIGRLRELGRDV